MFQQSISDFHRIVNDIDIRAVLASDIKYGRLTVLENIWMTKGYEISYTRRISHIVIEIVISRVSFQFRGLNSREGKPMNFHVN